ncbi:hypothetical protein SDC9_167638 [bioreactor metagenome]|uniref:Type I restriction modification DNA specificity domain-containing protein n=1 Tax=bioreactor metagenome TaxID=1076179 RepID=A0A645G2X9_9ZZZZ
MADPGKIGIVEDNVDAVFASYLIRLQPINSMLTSYYLFYMANGSAFQNFVLGASTGSTRKSISAETIKEAPILVPFNDLMINFEKHVKLYRDKITNLLKQNVNLRKTRDLLLPALIDGDLDVADLGIKIKEE